MEFRPNPPIPTLNLDAGKVPVKTPPRGCFMLVTLLVPPWVLKKLDPISKQ